LPSKPTIQAAQSLVDLIQDERRLNACSVNSRRLAEESFDRDKLAGDLIAVLEQVHTEWLQKN